MEAAAVKAAVSGTLNLVGKNLAPLVEEYKSIVRVKQDLLDLERLAKEVNNGLEAAGDRALGDSLLLEKLKEAAFEADDIVDEFKLKAEKYKADGDGGFVSRYLHKPKSFLLQWKAVKKIKKIKKTFLDIVQQSAVLDLVPSHDHVSHINNAAMDKQTLPFVDEASVIGRDQEMNDIISELLQDDDQERIKIVSIVGLGGSGKTTLAQLVFSEVKDKYCNHFPVKLWVHVSQEEFQLEKILTKLFDAISDERSDVLSLQYKANKISDRLTNQRFLIVLDDVWTQDRIKWEEFMVHIKNGSPGSRILLTTRDRNVAQAVESIRTIDLPLLSEDYSWKVFQQSYGSAVEHDFEEAGKEIVNKCGGVPLAIKVIAGILRVKKRLEQWHAIKECNLLNVDGKEHRVSACLWLSYHNLPSHIKQCFMICSIFPNGHLIDKDQLIDQWIAHDMVMEDGVNYLEYVGDDYFSHLVQMYFIQDVQEAGDGRVKCKMHDLVHDLAQAVVGDRISLAMPKKEINSTKLCRYFSIMEHPRHLPPKNTFQKARAMYIAQNDDFIFGKASKTAKHLRSITVKNVHTSALTAILETKNLRYLNISGLVRETLPEVISEIWSLQVLHVTSSGLVKLPESIGKLQKLRVVNLSYCKRLTGLPDSIGNCVMISTIDLFHCDSVTALPSSISMNKRLRVLRLGHTQLERLPSSITALESLECLDLRYCSQLVELPQGIGNLKKLVVLNLKECESLRAIPKGIAQLTRLETLGLFVMGEDDENDAKISELENVNKLSGELTIHGIAHFMDPDVAPKEWLKQKTKLQSLALICASDVRVNSGNELEGFEPPPGIKNLKIAQYSGQESLQWMSMLRFQLLSKLELSDFPKLERLEGLAELPCLGKLVLKRMNALKSISGGPFPKLLELALDEMTSLGVVWMATEGSLADLEGGHQVQIGNCLSVLRISKCPKLTVMPCFPPSLKELRLVKSNVQLLGQPGLDQMSSLPSSSAGLPSFCFSRLRYLKLQDMAPPAGAASYGFGCRWELLQHMTALDWLVIQSCDGLTELPESMRSLASLRTLCIWYCPTLRMLPECLGEFRYLERMYIVGCGSLSTAPSMQPLKALKDLYIIGTGWVGDLCCPSLETLNIYHSDIHSLPECLGLLRSLRTLCISEWPNLRRFPQSIGYLTSLQELKIESCKALHQLPEYIAELCSLRVFTISHLESLTCLPQWLGSLTSLQELRIVFCDAIGQLPESLGELHSLRKLVIYGLPGLTSVPESMCCLTSLEHLQIGRCPGIKSLTKWIKGLTALQTLVICDCPDLERRCKRRKGKDWHLISHIPHLRIGREESIYY